MPISSEFMGKNCVDFWQFSSCRSKCPFLFIAFMIFLYFFTQPPGYAKEDSLYTDLQAGLILTSLDNLTLTSNITGEKPQSKVWYHDNKWWAVLPNASGTQIWRLDGTSWTNALQISGAANSKADCKVAGNVVHILLVKGSSTIVELISLEYLPATQTYQTWSGRPSGSVNITLDSGLETATIDIDSWGRMWLASDGTTQINVRWSDSPYDTWSSPVTLASNISADVDADDICVVTAFDDRIGVLWSDQVLEEFGFKWHLDGATPTTWSAKENPPNPFGNTGAGFADDHLNVAAASDGTIYAAVKTGFDASGFPTIVLLVRQPAGTWNSYWVDDLGTRGIAVLNEEEGTITVAYTEITGFGNIVYRQSPTSAISFGPQMTLIEGSYNNVTSTKQNFTDQIVFFASDGTTGSSVLGTTSQPPVDLRGHWAMEEGSGTTLVDSSSYGNNAATVGSPVWMTGIKGLALELNGTTQHATVPDDPSLDITDAITLTAWIRPEKTATQRLIRKVSTTTNRGYSLFLSSFGYVSVRFNDDDNIRVNTSASYPTDGNTWMHVAATWDGATIRTYINGSPDNTLTTPFSILTNDELLSIGARAEDGGEPYQGLIDDVRVYSRALSPSEITALATPPSLPTFSTGGSGKALDFDGAGDYLNCGNDASLNITNQITLETWISPGDAATQYIIKKGTINVNDGYELSLASPTSPFGPQKVFARFNQQTSGNTYRVNSTATYPTDGSWLHIAVTYDGSTIRLYVNGVEEAFLAAAITIGTNSNPLTIGAEGDGTNNFNGILDEVRLWNIARTENEIRSFMCQKLTGSEPGLVGYWRFDEDVGLTAYDETGNDNNGTLTNMENADHIWSGAALGDESANDYTGSGGIFTANIGHPNGDNLTATTTSGTINGIQVYRADANALRPDASLLSGLETISQVRYWGVFVVGSGGPQYTVTYNYAGHPGITDENDLLFAFRDDHSVNEWANLDATLNTGARTLEKTGQSSREYALASATLDNSLPVELSAFTAAPGFDQITLKWMTESEINNLGFILERALAEEGPFNEIASYTYVSELQGQGNSNQQTEYLYVDKELENGTTYYYRLSDVDFSGNRTFYQEIISATLHVMITQFRLYANYPNPFNPNTTIEYALPKQSKVVLKIYNMLGEEIHSLVNRLQGPGIYKIVWDGRDYRGEAVASGMYIYYLKAGTFVKQRKMVLIQ